MTGNLSYNKIETRPRLRVAFLFRSTKGEKMTEEIETNAPDEMPNRDVTEYVPVKDRLARARKASETREADRQIDPKPHKGDERELSR